MKISYKKRHLNVNLIFGILWFIFGCLGIFTKEEPYWTDYGFLVISILYFIVYFYLKEKKYLTIENGILKENWPYGKQIKLSEIIQIRDFAGDFILKTEELKLKINTQIISPNSLEDLKKELEKLNIV